MITKSNSLPTGKMIQMVTSFQCTYVQEDRVMQTPRREGHRRVVVAVFFLLTLKCTTTSRCMYTKDYHRKKEK